MLQDFLSVCDYFGTFCIKVLRLSNASINAINKFILLLLLLLLLLLIYLKLTIKKIKNSKFITIVIKLINVN